MYEVKKYLNPIRDSFIAAKSMDRGARLSYNLRERIKGTFCCFVLFMSTVSASVSLPSSAHDTCPPLSVSASEPTARADLVQVEGVVGHVDEVLVDIDRELTRVRSTGASPRAPMASMVILSLLKLLCG